MSEINQPTLVEDGPRIDLGGVARVIVHRNDGATLFAVRGTLIKVSPGGVLLCLDGCVPYGKTVSMHIVFDQEYGEVDGDLVLDAKVAWTRPTEDGKWVTSCECGEELPGKAFTLFAQRGRADRRLEARRPTRLVAMARWQQSSDEQPIDIIDVSLTGFAVRASKTGMAGDALWIRFKSIDGDEVTIPAHLQWKVKTSAGYLGGCLLKNKTDVRLLAPYIVDVSADASSIESEQRTEPDAQPQVSTTSSHTTRRTRVRVGFALAAALLLMFVGPPLVVLRVLHADRANPDMVDSDTEVFESDALGFGDPAYAAAELAATVRPTDVRLDEPEVVESAVSPHDIAASEPSASGVLPNVDPNALSVGLDVDTPETDRVDTKSDDSPVVASAPAASTQLGRAAFTRGRVALASHLTDRAVTAFAEAAEAEPDVALHHYQWALALHMDGQHEAAANRVREAARIERMYGLANWGTIMSRIQGRARLWLERARRDALSAE